MSKISTQVIIIIIIIKYFVLGGEYFSKNVYDVCDYIILHIKKLPGQQHLTMYFANYKIKTSL